MSLRDFLKKQFIDVIQWTEPGDGILAYRYPMQDMEIQNGGKLTVRESQMAAFVNEGKIADIFGPGLYTLNTQTPAAADQPDELGQGVPVAVQIGRLLLLHAAADQPALGHAEPDHDPRQGFRHRAAARLRHLLLSHQRSAHVPHQGQRHARPVSESPISKASSATRLSAA